MRGEKESRPGGEIVLYETKEGARVECRFFEDSLWLPQALIAELFAVTVPTVNEYLKGIYAEGEVAPEATIRKFRIVRREGRNVLPKAGAVSGEQTDRQAHDEDARLEERRRVDAESTGDLDVIKASEQVAREAESMKTSSPRKKRDPK